MKKTAFEILDEAIEKRAALSPERMDYYEKKMNDAMEGKDSKDNRSSKELKKSYMKNKAKTAVGVPAVVGGAGMAGAMAPGLMKDFKYGIHDKRRIGIAGRAVGAAAIGAPVAVSGIKNLVKDRKEIKSRDNKLKNLWTDYIIEDMNEGRKERQKTAFEILDEAIEKRAALSPERIDYYEKKMDAAIEGKDSKDNRSSKELKKSYIKSKAKTAIGVPAAVGGAGLAGVLTPPLIKDIKAGRIAGKRKSIAGVATGAAVAAGGAQMAANGIKNLVKDRKEIKSRNNKVRNLWTDYIVEDMNEGRKERQKTAYEILDDALEKGSLK